MTVKGRIHPLGGGECSPYKEEQIIFESNTPGTYTLTPKGNCFCEATFVGAGAGGAYNSSSNRSSAAPGSSGSGCIVKIWLKKGVTYTIKVGNGGAKSGGVDWNTWGGNGEASFISADNVTLINAPGGNGGHVWWPNSATAAERPALCSFAADNNNFKKIEVRFNAQGNTGGTSTGSGGASVISGTTFGKGGSATQAGGGSNATNGNPGYAKLVVTRKK